MSPPPSNYFDFFGLPHRLNLDLEDLEKRFYALSKQFHPDLNARKNEQERKYSEDAAAILNNGYRTLKAPVNRAEYLLKEHGFDIGEQKSGNVPPELLEEVFELNMALEEMRGGDESAKPQLEEAKSKFVAMQEQIGRELTEQFARYDESGDSQTLQEIRGILNRRKYIRNLVNEVEKELN